MNKIIYRNRNTASSTFFIFLFLMIVGASQNQVFGQNGNWIAPSSADKITNPLKGKEKATLAGEKLYVSYCAICHGKKGKGDGVAGMALNPRPSNLTKDKVQEQTDGAIYWKMTEGKAPMAAYKATLTEEQRWQLVNFIRSIK